MTPEIITRSFSSDNKVFDEVFFSNKYNLKGHKETHPIVVDIGSHAGYFAFTALTLGARKLYCFEPSLDNFSTLLKNVYTPNFAGKVTPYQLGIYTRSILGEFAPPQLVDGVYFDHANIGLSTTKDANYYPCQCQTLDIILQNYCFNEQIDILKINTNFTEREVLLASESLKTNVSAIVGEISTTDEQLLEFKRDMGIKGFINFKSTPPDNKGRILFWASKKSLSENFVE